MTNFANHMGCETDTDYHVDMLDDLEGEIFLCRYNYVIV